MTDLGGLIADAARAYIGTRWHHLGRTREGMDCVGLVLAAYRDCGVLLDDYASYARGHRGDDMLAHIAGQGRRVPIDATADGDVLLFTDSLYVCHMGIRSTRYGEPAVVHAKLPRRRVTEEPLTGDTWTALRFAFRHPALEA